MRNKSYKNMAVLTTCIVLNVVFALCSSVYAESSCRLEEKSKIIFVRDHDNESRDGSSWDAAYVNIGAALNASRVSLIPTQIWVSKGSYVEPTYLLTSNTTVIGGFSGVETDLSQRNSNLNKTILSSQDGSFHVLFARNIERAGLIGLTVDGGRAFGDLLKDELLEPGFLGQANEVRGAGLFALNSSVTLCDTQFENNLAKKFGGAVYSEGGTISIINSVFMHNKVLRGIDEVHDDYDEADTDGGAIAVHDADLLVDNVKFIENTAGDDGAAIAGRGVNVNIKNSLFVRNKGIGIGLPVINPVFTNDFVTSMGGAISIQNEYMGQMEGDQSRIVIVDNSVFEDNQSSIASAMFILGSPGSLTDIRNTRFIGNGGTGIADERSSNNETGVRYGRGAAALLLVGSRAGDRETDDLGWFARPLHEADISNSYFVGNEAGQGGAAVFISLNVSVEGTLFENNVARMRGGAIWNQNFFSLFDQFSGLELDLGETVIIKSLFKNNKTLGVLETLQADSFPGVATNVEQTYGGGAISNDQYGILSVLDSIFWGNNSVNGDGGAIQNASSPIIAYGGIGASEFYPGHLKVSNSTFYMNSTEGSGSGGAIANGGNQLNGMIIDANEVDRRVDALGSQLIVEGSLFYFNSAIDFGGAIASWNGSSSVVENSTISGNSATSGGGISVVGLEDNLAFFTELNLEIFGNQAEFNSDLHLVNVK